MISTLNAALVALSRLGKRNIDDLLVQLPRLRACCAAHVRACRPVAPAAAGEGSSPISSLACQALFSFHHVPSSFSFHSEPPHNGQLPKPAPPRIPLRPLRPVLGSSALASPRLPPHCCLEQRGGTGHPLGTTRAAHSSGGCGASASSPSWGGGPALPPALRALLPDALSGALTPMVAARVALPSKTRGVDMLSMLSPESAALLWIIPSTYPASPRPPCEHNQANTCE